MTTEYVPFPDVPDADITREAWNSESLADHIACQEGRMTSETFWVRTHARDARIRAMSREDRLRINHGLDMGDLP